MAVLAVAALAVGGAAAAVTTMGSGGSPTAASLPPSSSSADPETSAVTSSFPASPPTPATTSTVDTRSTPPATTPSTATPPSTPSTRGSTSASGPSCLSTKQAYDLARQKNGGTMPADAKVSVLKCDDGWAAGRLASVTYGDASIVYEYDGAAWYAVDLGTGLCGGVVRGAPLDVRKALSC